MSEKAIEYGSLTMKSLSFLYQSHISRLQREQRCTKNGKYVPTGNHFIAQSNIVPVCTIYATLVTITTTTLVERMWIQLFFATGIDKMVFCDVYMLGVLQPLVL